MIAHNGMLNRQARLAQRFREQEQFATGYSLLYARLFGLVANWLSSARVTADPVANWLLRTSNGRQSLDVTLLLAAGLHREILSYAEGIESPSIVANLAKYFPTAGGIQSPEELQFEEILRQAILERQTELSAFIQHANVQTNETGRGLSWLLPLLSTGWQAVHLVDLGSSAGLNLVAEQRAFRLVSTAAEQPLLDLGLAKTTQFRSYVNGEVNILSLLNSKQLPAIASRTGGDQSPFRLRTVADEITLKSFIWGDQVDRMRRLEEGIIAFRRIEQSDAPVVLHPVYLPDELDHFLEHNIPDKPVLPVVIFNTAISYYLRDKGASLLGVIDGWASRQTRPVLWVQWEPPPNSDAGPMFGWLGWTIDLWQKNSHYRWQIAWVHPHGMDIELSQELSAWITFW